MYLGTYIGNFLVSIINRQRHRAARTSDGPTGIPQHTPPPLERIQTRFSNYWRAGAARLEQLTTRPSVTGALYGTPVLTVAHDLAPAALYDTPVLAAAHDLAPAASSAASLLSSFAASALTSNGPLHIAQKERLNDALAALVAVRVAFIERFGPEVMDPMDNELMVNAGCVVCFAQIVEIVLMPCRHMVVCAVGSRVNPHLGCHV